MKINNQIIFYMIDISEDIEKYYAFIINTHNQISEQEIINRDDYEEAMSLFESNYGVHDWGSSPSPEIEAIGYNSYEVENTKFQELIMEWQKVFLNMDVVSSVSKIVSWNGQLPDNSDFGIYKKTLELLK